MVHVTVQNIDHLGDVVQVKRSGCIIHDSGVGSSGG
jgi:hypothetical protein